MKRPRNGWSDATCDQEIICKYSFETKPIYEDVWPAQMWGYQVVVKQNIIEETWIQRFPVTWYCSKETRIWCSFKGILIGFQGYFFLGFQGGLMGFQGFILLERSLRLWPLVDQKGTQSLWRRICADYLFLVKVREMSEQYVLYTLSKFNISLWKVTIFTGISYL